MAKRARNRDICENCGSRYSLQWKNMISGSRYRLLCGSCADAQDDEVRRAWATTGVLTGVMGDPNDTSDPDYEPVAIIGSGI